MTWHRQIEHFRTGYVSSDDVWTALVEEILRQDRAHKFSLDASHLSEMVCCLCVYGSLATKVRYLPLLQVFSRTISEGSRANKHRTDPVFMSVANLVVSFQAAGLVGEDSLLAETRALIAALRTRRHETPIAHWEKALFGIALDDEAIWRNIAGVDPREQLQFEPGETFSLNMQGLIRYLAAGRRAKAKLEDVLPAWGSFLSASMPLIEADQIGYETVLWVSRIVHHDIGGHPLNEFGGWFHAEIQRAVAAGI